MTTPIWREVIEFQDAPAGSTFTITAVIDGVTQTKVVTVLDGQTFSGVIGIRGDML